MEEQHLLVLIVIPKKVFLEGVSALQMYIENQMQRFDKKHQDKFIVMTKQELETKYQEYQHSDDVHLDAPCTWDQYRENYAAYLDAKGNVTSTFHPQIFKSYQIGGQWDGVFANNESTTIPNCIRISLLLERINESPPESMQHIYDRLITGNGLHDRHSESETCHRVPNDQEWKCKFKILLEYFPDDYLVNLDCEIGNSN